MVREKKKKVGKKAKPGGLDEEDDRMSTATHETEDGSDSGKDDDSPNDMASLIEGLTEKGAPARLGYLRKLTLLLQTQYLKEELVSREETLALYLSSCIKRGGPLETAAACECAAIAAITAGEDGIRLYKDLTPELVTYARNVANPEVPRQECVRAAALLCFIASKEETDTLELMATLQGIWRTKKCPAGALAQAINSWGLLSTIVPKRALLQSHAREMMAELKRLLTHESLTVRQAAGECIAMLYSAYLETAAYWQSLKQEASGGGEDDAKLAPALAPIRPDMFHQEDLYDSLRELSTDGSKHKGKEERKKQRSVFRDVLATMEDGDVPEEVAKLGVDKQTFRGWATLRRLDEFRAVLGTGMNMHFARNPLLSDVFDFTSVLSDDLTKAQKQAVRVEQMQEAKVKVRAQQELNDKHRQRKQQSFLNESED